jgi:hypothetical protein
MSHHSSLTHFCALKVKLVNIRPGDIVDGKPRIILGLIWMLILCYQVSPQIVNHRYFEMQKNKFHFL